MEKILIPYNSIFHEKQTDDQINIIMDKINKLLANREIKVDFILTDNVADMMLNSISYTEYIDNIYIISFADSNNVDYKAYIREICRIAKENDYNYIFIPSGLSSKPIAASLSTSLEAGVTVDVIDMCLDHNKQLFYVRATASYALLAYIQGDGKTQIATLRLSTDHSDSGKDITLSKNEIKQYMIHKVQVDMAKLIHVNYEMNTEDINDNDDIVIGIGRGVSSEVLEKIMKFARKRNIKIMATKPCIENKTFHYSSQIGQSGCSIEAKLYIAVGVSGALHHIVGILGCKYIIAINPDKSAPIHNYADVSIIATAEEFFNNFEEELL